MWYKNIAGRFFGLVTKQRVTDRQNYDSQDYSVCIMQIVSQLSSVFSLPLLCCDSLIQACPVVHLLAQSHDMQVKNEISFNNKWLFCGGPVPLLF